MLTKMRVLVTGATGMIGRYLVDELLSREIEVVGVSLDEPQDLENKKGFNFVKLDLRHQQNCLEVVSGVDFVFHLAGIKGSPLMSASRPATFFTNTLLFNLNMMEAARKAEVSGFLYTSSIGVYAPAEILLEDSVWSTFPSPNDRFAGYAKRMGELQAEAINLEFGHPQMHIVRPANVYGRWDNFDPETAMVIPSLISKMEAARKSDDIVRVWGDGTPIRDFSHAQDVARAMIHVVENKITKPVNVGSGSGTSISRIVEILGALAPDIEFQWSNDGKKGDDRRVMNIDKLIDSKFSFTMNLESGLADTYDWFSKQPQAYRGRYNAFKESKK